MSANYTNNVNRPIVVEWEKWISPLEISSDDDGITEMMNDSEIDGDEEGSSYEDSYDRMDKHILENMSPGKEMDLQKIQPAFATPVGFFPITEHNKPSKAFNIWILHTNFRITEGLLEKVKDVDGIEAIQVISRYRLLLTIGLLFDEIEVKLDVQSALGIDNSSAVNIENESDLDKSITLTGDLKKKIDLLKQECRKHNYWAILVLPNGETRHIVAANRDEYYEAEVDLYRRTYDAVGGLVLIST